MKRIRNRADEEFYIEYANFFLRTKYYMNNFLGNNFFSTAVDDNNLLFLFFPYEDNSLINCFHIFYISVGMTFFIESVENCCCNYMYGNIL